MSNVTDFKTFSEYKVGVYIWKVVPPILIFLGTVGNILSIIVLTRKSIRSSTTALYLTVLAVSDLVVLYSGLLRQWLHYVAKTDVRHVSNAGCKINIWFVYTSLDFSAWILIAVTLERVVSAWLPHSARSTCTKKSALVLMSSILGFLLLLNCHMLYGMGFIYDDSGDVIESLKCTEVDQDYVHFFNKVWPWIDLCAFCLVPCSVIIVGNSLILFKVIKSQNKAKSRIVPSITTGNGHRQAANHGKQSSMTAMLFTLNIVFLVSTSPVSIYNIGYAHWEESAIMRNDYHELAVLDLWWAIVNMFMYTNNSLNFLLYCLSGTKFRQEVIKMFCRRARNNNMQMVPSNYTRTRFENSSAVNLHKKNHLNGSRLTLVPETPPTKNPKPTSVKNEINTKVTGAKNGDLRIATISGSLLHPDAALQMPNVETNETVIGGTQTMSSVV